jgi:hypothetical protein
MELSQTSMISELIISINLLGDINLRIDKFNPKMVYRFSRENIILFIPTIPITMNALINSNVKIKKKTYKPSDFIDVFSNPQKLNIVVQYIMLKKPKPITIIDAERNGIVKNNIELILSIYFDKENKFIYYNREFPIHSYNWNGMYQSKRSENINKKVPLYYINIDLYALDNKKIGNFKERSELTCNIKRRNIYNDLNELGFNFNIPQISTMKPTNTITNLYNPRLYNNDYRLPMQNQRPFSRNVYSMKRDKMKRKPTTKTKTKKYYTRRSF